MYDRTIEFADRLTTNEGLDFHVIPSRGDGNCLYNSLSLGLFNLIQLGEYSFEPAVLQRIIDAAGEKPVRKQLIQRIKNYVGKDLEKDNKMVAVIQDFFGFIEENHGKEPNQDSVNNFKKMISAIHTRDEIEGFHLMLAPAFRYIACELLQDYTYMDDGTHAGVEELRALSNLLGLNFGVHEINGNGLSHIDSIIQTDWLPDDANLLLPEDTLPQEIETARESARGAKVFERRMNNPDWVDYPLNILLLRHHEKRNNENEIIAAEHWDFLLTPDMLAQSLVVNNHWAELPNAQQKDEDISVSASSSEGGSEELARRLQAEEYAGVEPVALAPAIEHYDIIPTLPNGNCCLNTFAVGLFNLINTKENGLYPYVDNKFTESHFFLLMEAAKRENRMGDLLDDTEGEQSNEKSELYAWFIDLLNGFDHENHYESLKSETYVKSYKEAFVEKVQSLRTADQLKAFQIMLAPALREIATNEGVVIPEMTNKAANVGTNEFGVLAQKFDLNIRTYVRENNRLVPTEDQRGVDISMQDGGIPINYNPDIGALHVGEGHWDYVLFPNRLGEHWNGITAEAAASVSVSQHEKDELAQAIEQSLRDQAPHAPVDLTVSVNDEPVDEETMHQGTQRSIHQNNEEQTALPKQPVQHTDDEKNKRELLIKLLKEYIKKIDSYKATKDGFKHNFLFLKDSRSKNREANYNFAKKLLTGVEDDSTELNTLFNKTMYGARHKTNKRDVCSKQLNKIIVAGKKAAGEKVTVMERMKTVFCP